MPRGRLMRGRSGGGNREQNAQRELERRLELVEGGGDELVHTPSVATDLKSGMSQPEAARRQRLREQIRLLEAETADVRAQTMRVRLLRGPSGKTYKCDKDCILGGCQEFVAEEGGILCEDCGMFLCNRCFGEMVVHNECQVGGRFDKQIDASGVGGMMSAPGSLPCPLFPHSCGNGHYKLSEIQRALLDASNRGVDGASEDIESPGLSPHKNFLIARRRQAEKQLETEDGGTSRLRESTLVRTISEARDVSETLRRTLSAGLTTSSSAEWSASARAQLADKLDELKQLRDELCQNPVENVLSKRQQRFCAQCCKEFASFEGGACMPTMRQHHWLCNICFGGYLMKACAPGGVFEQALTNSEGMIVSPPGKLPCPFFSGHPSQLLVGFETVSNPLSRASSSNALDGDIPPLDCQCGAMELSTITKAMLDPRNSSVAFWRERQAQACIDTQAESRGINLSDMAESGLWSLGIELLSRGVTPSSVHETARLRVDVEKQNIAESERSATSDGATDKLADLYHAVTNALTRGASIQCPSCGAEAIKDDACVHMDTCPCGASWCFLCGKLSGPRSEGKCPRGSGGCDEQSCYLEQHRGWEDFALPAEHVRIGQRARAFGAQQEFLRRRQAFLVRKVKEETDPRLWARLQSESPKLFDDVPTAGRSIPWDSLDSVEFPLFGANLGRDDIDEFIPRDVEVDPAAEERFQRQMREELEADLRRVQREQNLRRVRLIKTVLTVLTLLGCIVVASFVDFQSPLTDLDPPLGMNVAGPSGASIDAQPAIKMRCAPGEVVVSGAIIGSCCSTACNPGATSCECTRCSDLGDHAAVANLADKSYESDENEEMEQDLTASDAAAMIFTWSASMRCTKSQAFKDSIDYFNCSSMGEHGWADAADQRACATEAAAAAHAAAATCGWRCDALFWYPVGALALAYLGFFLIVIFDLEDIRSSGDAPFLLFCFAIVTFLSVWPLIWSSPFGNVWVAMVFGPLCAGGMPAGSVTLFAGLCSGLDDDVVISAACCLSLISWLGYLYFTWDAREHMDATLEQTGGLCFSTDQLKMNTCLQQMDGALTSIDLVEISCTSVCLAMRWMIRSFGGVASVASLFVVRLEDMLDDDGACLKVPAFLVIANACIWWPEFMSDAYFATGTIFVTYCLVLFCFTMGWGGSIAASSVIWRRCERCMEWIEDYNLEGVAALPPLVLGLLIYLYRASVPEPESEGNETFMTIVHVQVVIVFLACVAATMMDGDTEDFLGATSFFMILVCQQDAVGLYSVWWLIFMLLYWNAFTAIVGLLIHEWCDNSYGGMASGCVACLFCVAVCCQSTWMGIEWSSSQTIEWTPAFQIQGATQASLNGIYVLRRDLMIDPDTIAETRSGDEQQECGAWCSVKRWWNEEDEDKDEDEDSQAEMFLQQHPFVPGEINSLYGMCDSTVRTFYQKGDEHGPVLYKPQGTHMWAVAPASVLLQCGRSVASLIHSHPRDCSVRPDGERCTGQWREVTANEWVDAPGLTVEAYAGPNCYVANDDDDDEDAIAKKREHDPCCGVVCDVGLSCVVDNPWPFPVHRCSAIDTVVSIAEASTAYSPPVSDSDVIAPLESGYFLIRPTTNGEWYDESSDDGERVPLENNRCGNSVGGLLLDRAARVSCPTPERPYCIDAWHDLAREGGSRGAVADRPDGDDRIDGRCEATDAKRTEGSSDSQERLYDYQCTGACEADSLAPSPSPVPTPGAATGAGARAGADSASSPVSPRKRDPVTTEEKPEESSTKQLVTYVSVFAAAMAVCCLAPIAFLLHRRHRRGWDWDDDDDDDDDDE